MIVKKKDSDKKSSQKKTGKKRPTPKKTFASSKPVKRSVTAKRKDIEKKLRESEGFYRGVVEDQTEIICRCTPDGTYTFVNDVFCRLYGKSREELIGKKWFPEAYPDDMDMINAKLATMSPANPVALIENRAFSGDGVLRWMQFVNRGFYDKNGNLLEIQAVGRDITERKQMELEVQKARDELEIKVKERTAELESVVELLREEITERRNAEEAVLNMAKGVSAAVGEKFFYSLAENLAKTLNADYAYIAEVIKGVPNRVRTLLLYADGSFIDNIEVDLTGTPCDTVREKTCSYPSGVQKLFPHAKTMAAMNVEGYIGTPLNASNGEWLGLMAVMYRKPVKNAASIESMLKIFAARVAAELERKTVEEALKESEQKYRRIVETSREGIWLIDDQDKTTFVNRQMAELLGYTVEEMLNHSFYEFMDEAARKEAESNLKRRSEGISAVHDFRFKRKDGSDLWAIVSTNPVFDDKGKFAGALGMVTDITERMKAGEALKIKDMAIESSINAIGITDFKANLTYVNPSFIKLWGYDSEKEVLGKSAQEFMRDEEKILDVIKILNEKGSWVGEMVARKKDGTFFDVQLSTSMVKDDSGSPLCMMASVLDITERKKAEEEIEAWNRELEKRVKEKTDELVNSQEQLLRSEKLSAMGHMAGGLAHELNSPLAGLLPMIEKYKNKAEKDSKEYNELMLMLKAAEHMSKIIRDFGVFSRETKGEFYVLDLKEAIEDTLSFSMSRFKQKNIQLNRKYEEKLPLIKGEKTELQQVFLNMNTNACDALSPGGELTIKTGISEDGNDVIMEFIDNGTGIEKEKLGRIFDPFYTTKRPGKGTGLGLSVSYSIIEKHGGSISVESEPGKGTRFSICLPAVKANNKFKKKKGDRINEDEGLIG